MKKDIADRGGVAISIIIPAYNTPIESFKKCLASIFSQSFTLYELIIVDDGSEMSFANEIDSILKGLPNAKVLHIDHSGVSVARNKGIEASSGKYVLFVDSDDCISADFVKVALDCAENEKADIVIGSVKTVEDCEYDKIFSPHTYFDMKYNYISYENTELWKVQEGLLCSERKVPPSKSHLDHGPYGKLFLKSAIGDCGFPEDIYISEDQVFIHSVLKNSQKCVVLDMIAYYYIINKHSVSHVCHADAIEVMSHAMEQLQQYLMDYTRLKEAFFYRVIAEMGMAFQLTYLNDPKCYQKFGKGVEVAQKIASMPIVARSLKEISLRNVSRKFAVQTWLLRHSLFHCFVFLKLLVKFRNRIAILLH